MYGNHDMHDLLFINYSDYFTTDYLIGIIKNNNRVFATNKINSNNDTNSHVYYYNYNYIINYYLYYLLFIIIYYY